MTTRKVIIKNQYLRLCKSIDKLIDKDNILPDINDHEFIDIIYIAVSSNCSIIVDY